METLRIYNGVSHPIKLYRVDRNNFMAGRQRDEVVLKNKMLEPIFVWGQTLALGEISSECVECYTVSRVDKHPKI